ncbi:MAG TPA: HEAT repeat domain-containing protein [Planctomycetota bacterium]|nr:HEAT repeat domain-containing protein [Planctomycetota bacterium]
MTKTLATIGFLFAGLLQAWAADDTEEVKEALAKFKKAMANPSAPARAAAAADLSRTPSDKTAVTLGSLLGGEADAVKIAAAEGLGNFKDHKKVATPLLLSALNANAKEPKVMEAVFKGLGKLDDDAALSTIHNYFDDKDALVANAAIMSAAEIRSASSMDPLISLMKKYEKIEEQAKKGGGGGYGGVNVPYAGDDPKNKLAKDVLPTIIKALQKIANEKWATTKEWEIWWNKNKATFKIAK